MRGEERRGREKNDAAERRLTELQEGLARVLVARQTALRECKEKLRRDCRWARDICGETDDDPWKVLLAMRARGGRPNHSRANRLTSFCAATSKLSVGIVLSDICQMRMIHFFLFIFFAVWNRLTFVK